MKKPVYVGNTNFSFVTENLRIFKIFSMKITILGKMKNFKFTCHKNMNYPLERSQKIDISYLNECYEFHSSRWFVVANRLS